jgi:hypothetical protein
VNWKQKLLGVSMATTLVMGGTTVSVFAQSSPSISSPAANLRATLDRLLSEHTVLAIVAMQKGFDGSPDFQAAAQALSQNTDDLTAAIQSVFGDAAAQQFKGMWTSHIGFFVDYVKATANHDSSGQQAALDKLSHYKEDFAHFLSSATQLPASALAQSLQMHVDELIGAFQAYVNKKYDVEFNDFTEAYDHMFDVGDTLAGAIVKEYPDKFGHTNPTTLAARLRITLDKLLGEHAELAVIAMQKGYNGSPDFQTAAAELGHNTDNLAAAIQSVYGDAAAQQFKGMWTSHIGFFVDYVKATAKHDEAGRQAALDKLAHYKQDFAHFLASANPNIDPNAIANALQMHVDQLTGAFDNYVNMNDTTAYMDIRQAFSHMFDTGDALASAIVKQYPDRFADANVSGATSPVTGMPLLAWMAFSGAMLIAGFYLLAFRRRFE